MKNWAANSLFYQIFPLGLCGAPSLNDFIQEPSCRLNRLLDWIKHLKKLEVNAVYLGPVFESTSHGYDTADYLMVDRRLGTNEDLARIIRQFHANNIKVVLDAVFNHVGRDFWAFKNVQCNKRKSPYQNWFSGLNFQKTSPYQDPFAYDGWNNHFNLVKLNLKTPAVKQYLFEVVQMWINTFQINGLRLDAADCLNMGFISELSNYCKKLKNDFWLLGEVIHGDYTQWIKAGLDSITNYECYKGLWSSFNDVNLFEIAYSLNRQFGDQGIYKKYLLYSFADNHDVTRVASVLNDKSHLYPLYLLLFTMPGIPSLYYGSEWGIEGLKTLGNDANLRPVLDLKELMNNAPEPDLEKSYFAFLSNQTTHISSSTGQLSTNYSRSSAVGLFQMQRSRICNYRN